MYACLSSWMHHVCMLHALACTRARTNVACICACTHMRTYIRAYILNVAVLCPMTSSSFKFRLARILNGANHAVGASVDTLASEGRCRLEEEAEGQDSGLSSEFPNSYIRSKIIRLKMHIKRNVENAYLNLRIHTSVRKSSVRKSFDRKSFD